MAESQKLERNVTRAQAVVGVDVIAKTVGDTLAVQRGGQQGGVKGPADVVDLEVPGVEFAVVAFLSKLDRAQFFELFPSPPVGEALHPET